MSIPNEFTIHVQLRWSDLDPFRHVRHSVYYDWGTLCRVEFFNRHELSFSSMEQMRIGPILFREECLFKKEIVAVDEITIGLLLLQCKRDYSRWTIQHQIWKNKRVLAAQLTVDGAWMDLEQRKLAVPPPLVQQLFGFLPRADNFQWND